MKQEKYNKKKKCQTTKKESDKLQKEDKKVGGKDK